MRRHKPSGDADAPGRTKQRGRPSVKRDPGRSVAKSLPPGGISVNATTDRDARTQARLEQHWQASELGEIDIEHAIYFADPFQAPSSRAALAEPIPGHDR